MSPCFVRACRIRTPSNRVSPSMGAAGGIVLVTFVPRTSQDESSFHRREWTDEVSARQAETWMQVIPY